METTDRLDRWIPRLMVLTVLAVAVFAFVQSYTHVYLLGQSHHQAGASLRMLPLSVDWLMFAAALTRLHLKRRDIRHWLPPAGLALGATATLVANIASGIIWGWESAAIAAWAPVVLFVTVELGMLLVRTAKAAKPEARVSLEAYPLAPSGDGGFLPLPTPTPLRQPSQPAPPPGDDTVTFPRIPEAVDAAPGDSAQGWGQSGAQEGASQGLNGIGLRNGRQ